MAPFGIVATLDIFIISVSKTAWFKPQSMSQSDVSWSKLSLKDFEKSFSSSKVEAHEPMGNYLAEPIKEKERDTFSQATLMQNSPIF